MAKIRLNVNKLGDPTVNYISLVSRGANRVPFRIVKQDKQESSMIDLAGLNLSKLFKSEKAAESTPPQPNIVGFVTMKDENFDLVKKHLKDAGFKISSIAEESDGSVVFKQQEEMPEEFAVLKMNDTLLVLVDNLDAEGAVDGTIYETLLKEDSFLPSQEIATQGLALAMGEISNADESPQDKVAKMELVTKDYNDYLAKLFNWVPAQLNVMASMLDKEIKSRSGVKPEATISELRGEIQDDPSTATDDDMNINQADGIEAKGTPTPIGLDNAMPKDLDKSLPGVSGGYNAKKGENLQEPHNTPEGKAGGAAGKKKVAPADARGGKSEHGLEEGMSGGAAATVSKSEEEIAAELAQKAEDTTTLLMQKMEAMFGQLQTSINEEITKQVGAVSEQVAEINSTVETLQKSQDVLHDRVVETEKIAKSADSVVRGRLITSDTSGDSTHQGVAKSEEPAFSGCIDTAFQSVRKMATPNQRGRASR